jgi:purine-binding chemotaxis protein CheW
MSTPPSIDNGLAGKYLVVLVGGESYGIAVLSVREIIRMQKITPVPHMPESIKGVINLRGRVIPIIDLRMRFGMKTEFTERTCIVVVQVATEAKSSLTMGLIVDCVEEVVKFSDSEIEATPDFGTTVDSAFIRGMTHTNNQVKMLLDIDRVVASVNVSAIEQSGA